MLTAKLRRMAVTPCELHCEGSRTIDRGPLDSPACEYEQICLYDVDGGSCF